MSLTISVPREISNTEAVETERSADTPELFKILRGESHANPTQRKSALVALIRRFEDNQKDPDYQRALLTALCDPDYQVRKAASCVSNNSDRLLAAPVSDSTAYPFCLQAVRSPLLPAGNDPRLPDGTNYKPEIGRMLSRMSGTFMALRLLDGGHSTIKSFIESEKIDRAKISRILQESPLLPLGTEESINILETLVLYQAWHSRNKDNPQLQKIITGNRYLSPVIEQVRKLLPKDFQECERILLN